MPNSPAMSVTNSSLTFKLFPAFAKFIREHHLIEYIQEQINLSREFDLPIMKHVAHIPDEQLIKLGLPTHIEFLQAAEANTLSQLIKKSLKLWQDDKMGILARNDVAAEDITIGAHVRKKALIKFSHLYTTDPTDIIELINEIDAYSVASVTEGTNTYIKILKEQERESEEQLKQSEARLLEAQALAGMGSYEWDTETDTIVATPQFYKIFATDSNYANDILQGVHPADMSRVKAARMKAVAETGIYDIEYRFLAGDKEKVIWTRGAVYFKNGRKMMRGTVMDITERKHIIQSLQRSEELYKQAQAMSHIGNWTWDLKAGKFAWSDELYKIYGLKPGTPITSEFLISMNHPDDNKMIQDTIARSMETHEPYDFYYRILSLTGAEKIVHANGNVWVDSEGQAYKMSGTVQDVTERQKLIERLQTSEARYKQAQAMAHIGNWEWYIEDDRIEWTDELYRIYGLDPDKGPVTYEEYTSLLHPDERELIMANVQKSINEHIPYEINHRIVLKTGGVKYLRSMGDVLLDKEGKVIKLFGTAQDITAQKEIEIAMQQKNIELSYSNTSLEEFAYVASHDLKEPLRKISTFGDLMLNTDKDRLSDTGKNYMDKIISSAKRMQTMINDLMSVSTITGNKSFESYDLNEIAAEVLGVLEFNIREKNATITYNSLPTIHIVPSQFRHLFQNLLSNSLKFSKPDVAPIIDINASYITQDEAQSYGLTERKQYVKLVFTDNGIGFEKEYANKIFTIFQRLHGKSDYEGNGIGLSICKKVAENHKGVIFANSTLREGAVFTIIVPV